MKNLTLLRRLVPATLIAGLLDMEERGELERRDGELRFLDLLPDANRAR